MKQIAVIDLFAGPGGLSEGFSSLSPSPKKYPFLNIGSFEKDAFAHKTLTLRHYFHNLVRNNKSLSAYEAYVAGINKTPFSNSLEEKYWLDAKSKTHLHTLGEDQAKDKKLRSALKKELMQFNHSVLIGGPPCQAYSLVGRARNKGNQNYVAEEDDRHFLYKEYLKFLSDLEPSLFVMENVKGILSAKVNGALIFPSIIKDLVQPFKINGKRKGSSYVICSLVNDVTFTKDDSYASLDPRDFIIRSEEFGVPQTRHRVILLGIREDLFVKHPSLLSAQPIISVKDAISDLPKIRSDNSKAHLNNEEWSELIKKICKTIEKASSPEKISKKEIERNLKKLRPLNKKSTQISAKKTVQAGIMLWYKQKPISVILNHESRSHMESDLERYMYLSMFANQHHSRPHPNEWPTFLTPNHKNWSSGKFADRFKVQLWNQPSSTITSHISKDGHHYIHPDPIQCRSFTVREAARIQTFPDNYFFEGPRTEQFHQVGNAVPAFLSHEIAKICFKYLTQ